MENPPVRKKEHVEKNKQRTNIEGAVANNSPLALFFLTVKYCCDRVYFNFVINFFRAETSERSERVSSCLDTIETFLQAIFRVEDALNP